MSPPPWRFRQIPYAHCITLRCDGACAYCRDCRAAEPPGGWDRRPAGDSGADPRTILLSGGDPFRYGDLIGWVGWARGNDRAWIEVAGPAASLADEDGDALVARIASARPDAVSATLPTLDAARTDALTGRRFSPARALDRLEALARLGVAPTVVLPVNENTVDELAAMVTACATRLGARADIVLRRAPTVRGGGRRLPVLGERPMWGELDSLSAQLSELPTALPDGARLHMDPERGYAPCMLTPPARRSDLVYAHGGARAPQRSLGDACDACSWNLRCTWRDADDAPPRGQLTPLDDNAALALQSGSAQPEVAHLPHAARWSRVENRVPDVLCVAPWTSLSATESYLHPVPCAISWVDNAVPTEDAARALEITPDEVRALIRIASTPPLQGVFHCLDNDALSLADLWNNPLLRVMRRQMLLGGKTRHCRSMCRTVMGVEDRGADLLARPDSELTPAIVANRNLLLDELRGGRTVLLARPLDLVIGVASHCNITCGFCYGPEGKRGELTDGRREEVKQWLPTLMSFSVSGPGEPLMSGNYLALLAHIADTGYPALSVALTTNGTLLTPAFLERHRGVRWAHVRISLNAGTAATHERMTGRKMFSRVMANLEALVRLRDAGDPPFEVTLSCVLSRMVMGELHAFAELATSIRANVVVEPMYGDQEGLSPWIRAAELAALQAELSSVADAFALRNPPLSRAFRGVAGFARARIDTGDLSILEHH